MINRKVLDLSHHNNVTSWPQAKAAGILGIIHKATEGTSLTDNMYGIRKPRVLSNGLKWGAYHFANGSNVQDQVNHFLSVAGIDQDTLYALDWEDVPGNTMSLDQVKQFLQLIEAKIGIGRCVIYSGNRAKEALGSSRDSYLGSHRLWLAQYTTIPVVQASWPKYWLWQYSDGTSGPEPHGCPGVEGEVDTNHWDGTDQELLAQWAGAGAAPAPEVPQVTITIETVGNVKVNIKGA